MSSSHTVWEQAAVRISAMPICPGVVYGSGPMRGGRGGDGEAKWKSKVLVRFNVPNST